MCRESESEMNAPSERIKSLVNHRIMQPAVWNFLTDINQSVISLEVQNEELRQQNEELVALINDEVDELPVFVECDLCGEMVQIDTEYRGFMLGCTYCVTDEEEENE